MKKFLLIGSLSLMTSFISFSAVTTSRLEKDIPVHFISSPDLTQVKNEDSKNDKNGMFYRIGVFSYTNITSINSGKWSTLSNGDRMWQLNIQHPGAEALSFLFSSFNLSKGSIFYVENKKGERVSDVLTKDDILEYNQQHIALCFGDDLILTLIDPSNVDQSEFMLDRIIYNYRSTGNPNLSKINESDAACEVNVNCSEGANYQDEKRGAARIYVVGNSGAGWCSGSLINNLGNNCKPYFLSALHCGPSPTTTVQQMATWKFYFNYESPNCSNPSTAGTLASKYVTGCVRLSDSNDNNGSNITKSDFILVQLGTLANEATTINKLIGYNAYWNGWDANNTIVNNGVSIHHPSGDIKKISTFSTNLTSSSWANVPNTHWTVVWAATSNGHGVTEGGSSGSPIFTYNSGNSRIIGTLSGGSSYCTATSSPDKYGKFSYHWKSNGTASNQQLKPFLDPNSTGTLVMNGSSNPCNFVGLTEATLNQDVKIYPNPSIDVINVDLNSLANQKVEISILDMAGKVVYTSNSAAGNLVKIDISSFGKGIYQVILKSEGQQFVQRISKI